jgi:hypothetical protein
MSRLITNVLVALLTFLVSGAMVTLESVRSPTKRVPIDVVKVPVNQPEPIAVSVCDLRDEALYQGKVVVLRGVIYTRTDGTLLLYEGCPNGDYGPPVVTIDLEGLNSSLIRLLNDLAGSPKRLKAEADVRVVGRVGYDYSAGYFREIHLDTFDLNVLSSLRPFRPKGAA